MISAWLTPILAWTGLGLVELLLLVLIIVFIIKN